MAYRRTLSIRSTLLARRFNPSLTYISQHNDCKKREDFHSSGSKIEPFLVQMKSSFRFSSSSTCLSHYNDCKKPEDLHSSGSKVEPFLAPRYSPTSTYLSHYNDWKKSESWSKMETFLAQRRSLGSYYVNTTFRRTPCGLFGRTPYGLFANEVSLKRGISTYSKVAIATANVAIAAAVPVLASPAVQDYIDGVHSVTGLNWWASISVATFLAHVATLPVSISLHRKRKHPSASSFTVDEDTKEEYVDEDTKQVYYVDEQDKKKHKITILDVPRSYANTAISISFLFAILDMAEKVPSFKTGGTLWFTDLSTPDAMYILPISMALIFLFRRETLLMRIIPKVAFHFEAAYPKYFVRACAASLIPLTMYFPTAMLCSWITSSLFNCCLSLAFRDLRVQKALGIPPTITTSVEVHRNPKRQV